MTQAIIKEIDGKLQVTEVKFLESRPRENLTQYAEDVGSLAREARNLQTQEIHDTLQYVRRSRKDAKRNRRGARRQRSAEKMSWLEG